MASFSAVHTAVVTGVVVFGTTGACLGQMTPISESRSMEVSTSASAFFCPADSDTMNATPSGLHPWSWGIDVESQSCDLAATARAWQDSSMGRTWISAQGTAGWSFTAVPSLSGVTVSAANIFRYTFSVSKPADYLLNGSWTGAGNSPLAFNSLTLIGPNGMEFSSGGAGQDTYMHAGTLQPGEYEVELFIRTSVMQLSSAGAGSYTMSYHFAVIMEPCPCDWNQSGGVNSQDFFDFLNSFFLGDADYNGSGETDSQDFFDFLGCFFVGCE